MGTEPARKIKSFRESEKVKDLEFGENWYGHLSGCFFHGDLPTLKDHSYFGGVSSCNTIYDGIRVRGVAGLPCASGHVDGRLFSDMFGTMA